MTDVLSHVRDGVNEARRLFADQKLRVDRSMAAGEDAPLVRFTSKATVSSVKRTREICGKTPK